MDLVPQNTTSSCSAERASAGTLQLSTRSSRGRHEALFVIFGLPKLLCSCRPFGPEVRVIDEGEAISRGLSFRHRSFWYRSTFFACSFEGVKLSVFDDDIVDPELILMGGFEFGERFLLLRALYFMMPPLADQTEMAGLAVFGKELFHLVLLDNGMNERTDTTSIRWRNIRQRDLVDQVFALARANR